MKELQRDIVLEAVRNNGYALQFVYSELREDVEVVLVAARSNPEAIRFAPDKIADVISNIKP